MKRSVVYSQGIRIKRICSLEEKANQHLLHLRSWFCDRGYPNNVVDDQLEKVHEKSREELFLPKVKKACGVPFVVTFASCLKTLGKILRKHLPILYTDKRVREVFTPAPFISCRSGYSLRNHLVRAKVPPLERKAGSERCKSPRCQTCNNVEQTVFFESTMTKERYRINHQLDCNSKCLVYLLTCKVCNIQYVGQTSDKFRLRWNNYRNEARKAHAKEGSINQKHLHNHFLQDDHNGFLEDCHITFIDKTDTAAPTQREKFWITRLQTLTPHGLNV